MLVHFRGLPFCYSSIESTQAANRHRYERKYLACTHPCLHMHKHGLTVMEAALTSSAYFSTKYRRTQDPGQANANSFKYNSEWFSATIDNAIICMTALIWVLCCIQWWLWPPNLRADFILCKKPLHCCGDDAAESVAAASTKTLCRTK